MVERTLVIFWQSPGLLAHFRIDCFFFAAAAAYCCSHRINAILFAKFEIDHSSHLVFLFVVKSKWTVMLPKNGHNDRFVRPLTCLWRKWTVKLPTNANNDFGLIVIKESSTRFDRWIVIFYYKQASRPSSRSLIPLASFAFNFLYRNVSFLSEILYNISQKLSFPIRITSF